MKIPWRRARLPTPVFWPGEFHGLYSPWGRKESDVTERLSLHFKITILICICQRYTCICVYLCIFTHIICNIILALLGNSKKYWGVWYYQGFPGSSEVKTLLAVLEMQIGSLDLEDPLEKEMATHSSILAWETPWTEDAQASVHGVAKNWTQLSDWARMDKLQTCCLAYKVFFPLSSQVSLTTTSVRWLNTYNSCLLSRQIEVQRWVFWPESLSIQ